MTDIAANYTLPTGTTTSLSDTMTYMIDEMKAGNPISGGGWPDSYYLDMLEGPDEIDSFQSFQANYRFQAKDYDDHYYIAVPRNYYDVEEALFDRSMPGAMRQIGLGDNVGAQSAKAFVYDGVPYLLFRLSATEAKWAKLYSFGGEFQSTPLPQDITFDVDGLTTLDTGINVIIPININYELNDSAYLDKSDFHFYFVPKSGLAASCNIYIVVKDINGNEIHVDAVTGIGGFGGITVPTTLRELIATAGLGQNRYIKKGYSVDYRIGDIVNMESVTFKKDSFFKVQVNNETNEIILPDGTAADYVQLGYLFQPFYV